MPVSAETLDALLKAGLSGDALVSVVSHIDRDMNATPAAVSDQRSTAAKRQARYRERQASLKTQHVTSQPVTKSVTPERKSVTLEASPDDASRTREIENTNLDSKKEDKIYSEASLPHAVVEKPKRSASDASEVRLLLETVLSPEMAKDFTAHRKAVKAPLTMGAAKKIVKEFGKHGDPASCAETAMARGWRGFAASWMVNEKFAQAREGPRHPFIAQSQRHSERQHEQPGQANIFEAEPAEQPARKQIGHDAESYRGEEREAFLADRGHAQRKPEGANAVSLGGIAAGIVPRWN